MRRPWISLLLLAPAFHSGAELRDADREWMQATLGSWQTVAREDLRLPGAVMPWVIFFGDDEVWHVRPDSERLEQLMGEPQAHAQLDLGTEHLELFGYAHGGAVRLPDGEEIPAQLILFASTYGEDRAPYFVFAMPEIWRATPRHSGEETLDALIASVFIHEITHTQQANTLGPHIDDLVEAHGLDDDSIDDDMVQRQFESRPGAQESFDVERDLYFEAAAAATEVACRELTRTAIEQTRKRQSAWFRGDDALFAEFEDIFLIFEGSANWAAFRALIRSGMPEEEALPTLRRGGKWWSQDLGLAIFLVLERLHSPWRESAFSAQPGSLFELLEQAVADKD